MTNARAILKTISIVCTGIGFVTNLISGWANDRQQTLEIREAVTKEVTRQLAIPMKKRDS
ncbi:MAG: hypothetical protein J6U54_03535 [Clostridiales bacterium]|nr:hypothetical protein [Clostridiales bacterium]